IDQIVNQNQSYTMDQPIRINDLLPVGIDQFYRYYGSYTTPDCQEIVTWVIFRNPINIDVKQVQKFRDLIFRLFHSNNRTSSLGTDLKNLEVKTEEMLGYYRHIQELGTRRIHAPYSLSG